MSIALSILYLIGLLKKQLHSSKYSSAIVVLLVLLFVFFFHWLLTSPLVHYIWCCCGRFIYHIYLLFGVLYPRSNANQCLHIFGLAKKFHKAFVDVDIIINATSVSVFHTND